MGIRLQDQKKLFERFYRVEGENTNSIAGFGIGLYICKEIIEGHQGQIGVESNLGKGSTFWFTLPLV
jgi:two-component system sensor histidine kinase VicK